MSDPVKMAFERRVVRLALSDKLARALNVNIKRIKTKRTLFDEVCPEVAEVLKDKSVDSAVFALLRKIKPPRQLESVELMAAMNNYTARYAHALLAALRQEDLAQPDRPKKIRGLTPEQMARMEREMDGLQREFKAVAAGYGNTGLNLVVALGYISSLIGNPGVSGYLERHHPEILTSGDLNLELLFRHHETRPCPAEALLLRDEQAVSTGTRSASNCRRRSCSRIREPASAVAELDPLAPCSSGFAPEHGLWICIRLHCRPSLWMWRFAFGGPYRNSSPHFSRSRSSRGDKWGGTR
jgi:hypothetical protein